jgi:hypothetical protein
MKLEILLQGINWYFDAFCSPAKQSRAGFNAPEHCGGGSYTTGVDALEMHNHLV